MPELWLRIGDGGEYEPFGQDVDAAISALHEFRVRDVTRWRRGGCDTVNFCGYDYISLYWGDSDAEWEADLDDDEKAVVESELKSAVYGDMVSA